MLGSNLISCSFSLLSKIKPFHIFSVSNLLHLTKFRWNPYIKIRKKIKKLGLKQVIGPLSWSQPNSKGKEKTDKTYRRETGGERERKRERENMCALIPLCTALSYRALLCV